MALSVLILSSTNGATTGVSETMTSASGAFHNNLNRWKISSPGTFPGVPSCCMCDRFGRVEHSKVYEYLSTPTMQPLPLGGRIIHRAVVELSLQIDTSESKQHLPSTLTVYH